MSKTETKETEGEFKCADCGCAINEGEFKTFGVCDSCWDKHHGMHIRSELQHLRAENTRSELQNLRTQLKIEIEANEKLRSELQKAKELNGELVKKLEDKEKELKRNYDWMGKGPIQ